MDIKKSSGIRGKKNQERIDISQINEDFVIDFPLTPTQKKIIEIIYFMRALKTSHIVEILGLGSYSYVTNQLMILHLNRFIMREFPLRDRIQKGTKEAYYQLDECGAIYISGAFDIPLKDIKWKRRDNLIKIEKLEHTFMVSKVRACLEKEARQKGHKIIQCMGDRHIHTMFTYENQKYEFRPDMYVKYSDGKFKYEFLFEIDMGTMSITATSPKTSSFDRKVPYYEYFKMSEQSKYMYEGFPRVIVITQSTDRAKKLAAAVKVQQKSKVEFYFTTFMFWEENCLGAVLIDSDGQYGRQLLD